jgi:hypothetical protein
VAGRDDVERDDVVDEERADEATREDDDGRPVGALAVTSFLMVTILVLWFGMYLLNVSRS